MTSVAENAYHFVHAVGFPINHLMYIRPLVLNSNRIIKTYSLGPWSNAKSPGDTINIGNINDYSLFLFISGGANGYYSYITAKGYVNTSTNHHIVGGSKTDGTQGTVKFHVENNNTLVIDESDCAYGIRQVYGLFC